MSDLDIVITQAVAEMRKAERGLHRRFQDFRILDSRATEWFKFTSKKQVEQVKAAFREAGSS